MKLFRHLLASLGGHAPAQALPAERRVTPGGTSYVFRHSRLDDTVALLLNFKGGFLEDFASDPPTALVAPAALVEDAFASDGPLGRDELIDLGGTVGLLPGPQAVQSFATAPKTSIDAVVDLLRHLLAPRPVQQQSAEAGIAAARANMARAAGDVGEQNVRAFVEAALEPGPQFNPFAVSETDLDTVQPDDVASWRDRHIVHSRLSVCLVGPIDASAADQLVDQVVSVLAEGEPAETVLPTLRQRARELVIARGADAGAQTTISMGAIAMRPTTPEDFFAAHLYAHILAGDEKSRLFRAIRDEAQATYGLRCLADVDAHSISMSIEGSIDPDSVEQVIERVREIVKDLAANGPQDDEVAHAKAALQQFHQAVLARNDATATHMSALMQAGWSLEAMNDTGRLIEGVDLRHAGSLLRPLADTPIIVVAG